MTRISPFAISWPANLRAGAFAASLLAALGLAAQTYAAAPSAERAASPPPAVLHGSASNAARQPPVDRSVSAAPAPLPTVLRGMPEAPPAPESAALPGCPEGSYYAAGLGCVVPAQPGEFGYVDYYGADVVGIPVVVLGYGFGHARRPGFRRGGFYRGGFHRGRFAGARRFSSHPFRHRMGGSGGFGRSRGTGFGMGFAGGRR